MLNLNKTKKKKGFTIPELLCSMLLLAIAFTGILNCLEVGQYNTVKSNLKLDTTSYAKTIIEYYKSSNGPDLLKDLYDKGIIISTSIPTHVSMVSANKYKFVVPFDNETTLMQNIQNLQLSTSFVPTTKFTAELTVYKVLPTDSSDQFVYTNGVIPTSVSTSVFLRNHDVYRLKIDIYNNAKKGTYTAEYFYDYTIYK